jgi:hypothetical protein
VQARKASTVKATAGAPSQNVLLGSKDLIVTYWVARLNPADAAGVWEKVCPLLDPAIRRSGGLYEPDDVKALVTGGGWSLWLAGDDKAVCAAWTTVVKHFPRGKVLEIPFAGGAGAEGWYEQALAETDKFAREMGCDRLRCAGRKGWARMGYRTIGYVHERTLA